MEIIVGLSILFVVFLGIRGLFRGLGAPSHQVVERGPEGTVYECSEFWSPRGPAPYPGRERRTYTNDHQLADRWLNAPDDKVQGGFNYGKYAKPLSPSASRARLRVVRASRESGWL